MSHSYPKIGIVHITIIITNPNHHWQIIKPIVQELQKDKSVFIELISLCELRRMKSPIHEFKELGVSFKVVDRLKRFTLKKQKENVILGAKKSVKRELIKRGVWLYILKPFIRRHIKNTDKVVLFNDAAFPGPSIVKLLKARRIHVSLIQEGIRFPLPNEDRQVQYGGSDIDVIYSWGQKSAAFFKKRNHKGTKIVAAGCPRLDLLSADDFNDEINKLSLCYEFDHKNWIICSNPIDDQGYLNESSKWKLIVEFVRRSTAILRENGIKLWIKLHPGEKENNLLNYLDKYELTDEIHLIKGNIFSILSKMELVIVLASTVGLEALCLKKRLAVLNIPGHGYQFDYVDEKAGSGIDLQSSSAERTISKLAESEWTGEHEEDYLDQHLSHRGYSAKFIAQELLKND